MLKNIFLIIFSFSCTLFLQAHDKLTFTAEEKSYIKNNTFDVAILPDFPPFSIYKNKKLRGFSYDILELMSKKHDLKFNYIVDVWPTNIKKFKEKKVDIIDAISFKEKRLSFTNYTDPYYEIPLVIFSRKDLTNYENINDLKGKRLGITKNIFYKDDIKETGIFDVVGYDSFADKLKALAFGEVDVIFGHLLSTQVNIIKSGYTNIKVLGELNLPSIKKTDLRFGITKENILLNSIIQKSFKTINKEEWATLYAKWITSIDVKKEQSFFDESIPLSKEEKAYIKTKKIIKIQNEKNWPPYNFNENNEAKGFSIDYTNLLAKKLGLKVEYVTGPSWNEFMSMLQNREIDVINNISKNKERDKTIEFTNIFHTAANAIYVKNGDENIDSLEKLKDKTIVMPKGFFAQQLLEKHYPEIKQVLVKDSLEALKFLSLGKADATIGKKNVLDYIISNNNISGVTATNFVDDNRLVSLIRMGVVKGELHLRNILQKAQDSISDEQLLNLKRKWFGKELEQIKRQKNYMTVQETDYLKQRGAIRYCLNKELTPISFLNENGRPKGMSIDILEIFSNKLNIPFVHIPTKSFEDSLQLLKNKECDLIPSIENNELNFGNTTLTYPYLNYKLAVITRKNIPIVPSIEDIIDEKVALKKDSQLIRTFQSTYPGIQITTTQNDHKALEAVNNKKAYYTLAPLPIASYYMSRFAMTDLYISRYSNLSYTIHMSVRDDDPILLNIINKSIQKLTEEEKRESFTKWSSFSIKEKFDYALFWKVLFMTAGLILFLLYRQIVLNKHNRQLKRANKEIAQLTNNLEERVKSEVRLNEEKTKQLIEQSRLAQMGELINMIAHQWRQPLTAISATTNNILFQVMLKKELDTPELEKELLLINDYSQHLSSTIDDFRNFYKKDKTKKTVTLEEVVKSALNIIQSSLENNMIQLQEDYQSHEKITTYPKEITHVVLNIVKNAEDIFKEKKMKNSLISINTYNKNNIIVLEISNNGGTIKNEHIKKIFEPYFSTKKAKEGTGLGLYMSKLIIEEHCKGKLCVENIDNGVLFRISIPKGNK